MASADAMSSPDIPAVVTVKPGEVILVLVFIQSSYTINSFAGVQDRMYWFVIYLELMDNEMKGRQIGLVHR